MSPQTLHFLLACIAWLTAAAVVGDYIWGCLLERRILRMDQLQFICIVVSVLLALQMNDSSYTVELQGSALGWRLFWHSLKTIVLAASITLYIIARRRWKLDLH